MGGGGFNNEAGRVPGWEFSRRLVFGGEGAGEGEEADGQAVGVGNRDGQGGADAFEGHLSGGEAVPVRLVATRRV